MVILPLLSFASACQLLMVCVESATVKLYHENRENEHFSRSFDECVDLPKIDVYGISSDTCAMVYRDDNCNSTYKLKVLRGEMTITNTTQNWMFGSVQKCNDLDGGDKLNVDVTEYQSVADWNNTNFVPNVLYSYRDVCTCVNLPVELELMTNWSINNHGNELLVYFEQNCLDERRYGDLIGIDLQGIYDSIQISSRTKMDAVSNVTLRVKSFGPNPNSTYFTASCTISKRITRISAQIREVINKIKENEENIRKANATLIDEMKKELDHRKELGSLFNVHAEYMELDED